MSAKFYNQYYSNFELFNLRYTVKSNQFNTYDILIEKLFGGNIVEFKMLKGFSNDSVLAVEFARALSEFTVTPDFVDDCYDGCMDIAVTRSRSVSRPLRDTAQIISCFYPSSVSA